MKINYKRLWLFIPIGVAGFLYYIFGTHLGGFIECPINKYFGLDCPGCGATRMAVSMIELHFYQAFRYNPLLFVLLRAIVVMVSFMLDIVSFEGIYERVYQRTVIAIGIVTVIYFIMRNIPIFYFLRPTVVG